MKMKNAEKIIVLGVVSCLLTGCGNCIPELTEEEASLIATYASDVTLGHNKESESRLIDTEKERARRDELSAKIADLSEKQAAEEETEAGQYVNDGAVAQTEYRAENIADFIGLDGFQVSYDGYEIKNSYAADETDEWEPTFDATVGQNLLIVKLKITNVGGVPAVADVLSKDMMFSIQGDNGMGGMAFVTMLLNDFAFAQDEIEAGGSRQYVLITQIDESITETQTLSLHMKKGDENMIVNLQ
ncbi:hypothetical protein D7X98_18790 [bacterium 1XD8-76]|nr:hypothetical protein D7X98_18790 [bacterium 1XD8-76]